MVDTTRWLKPDQVRAMRRAAQSNGTPYLRDRNEVLIAFLYDTGLRVNECVSIDTDLLHLDDSPPYLSIPADIQKDYPNDNSPDYREMELGVDDATFDTPSRIQSYLINRWTDSPALFPSRQSDRMTSESVRNVVGRLAEWANIRPHTTVGRGQATEVTPHTLRHSVAYRMLHDEDDYTLYDVRNRLRHATINTTERRYDHFVRI